MKTSFKRREPMDGKSAYNIMTPEFRGIIRWFADSYEWALLHYPKPDVLGRVDRFCTLREAKDEAIKTYG